MPNPPLHRRRGQQQGARAAADQHKPPPHRVCPRQRHRGSCCWRCCRRGRRGSQRFGLCRRRCHTGCRCRAAKQLQDPTRRCAASCTSFAAKPVCAVIDALPAPGTRDRQQTTVQLNELQAPGCPLVYSVECLSCQVPQLDRKRSSEATTNYITHCCNDKSLVIPTNAQTLC